jgi:uncharacterized protein
MNSLVSILGVFVLIYAALVLLIYIFQSHFIFFPEKSLNQTPTDVGLDFEDVNFSSSDNVKLHGWFISVKNSIGVLLFCHGNAGNISHRLESIQIFSRLGLNVFIFDYRGYGQSQGKMTENGAYLDAKAAWNYLTQIKNFNPNNIIIFGRSLGGSIATKIALNNDQAALIIESTFTSAKDMAAKHYPFLPVRLLLKYNFQTIDYIQNVKSPILIIHSENDEIVPFSQGQKLFETASEPKEFLKIHGGHNDGFFVSEPEYSQKLNLFMKKYLCTK